MGKSGRNNLMQVWSKGTDQPHILHTCALPEWRCQETLTTENPLHTKLYLAFLLHLGFYTNGLSIHSIAPDLEDQAACFSPAPASGNSENGPSNKQQKMRSSKDGDGLDTPSESQRPVPHVKPWPETHRERESEAAQETAAMAIWRLKQIGWAREL